MVTFVLPECTPAQLSVIRNTTGVLSTPVLFPDHIYGWMDAGVPLNTSCILYQLMRPVPEKLFSV